MVTCGAPAPVPLFGIDCSFTCGPCAGSAFEMVKRFLLAILFLCLPALASAADISGPAKIRAGDQVAIGNARLRLAGIDAPAADQLCLNAKGERWACGAAARDELIRLTDGKPWTCKTTGSADRYGRVPATCTVDGADIQQWLVKNGWALALPRPPRLYEAEEKAARDARAGLWAGAFIAPWDWRVRNKKTVVMGAVKPPPQALAILLASASGRVAPSPECTIKGNVNRSGVCIYHKPTSRWYAKIDMRISRGTRWFCSVDEAEAAGCRETRR
jgi:endonuclease YncB( thermonuclease family)